MKQWSIAGGPSGTLLVVGDPDNPVQTLIQNVDEVNTVYLGETAGVNPNNPLNSVPLGPGQTSIATGDINVFGISAAPGQFVAVNTMRGFGNFFQQSIVNGTPIYGGSFIGLDFEINSQGAFFYLGPPAFGNLKISIVSNGGGTDRFNNVYRDNVTAYYPGTSGFVQIAANPTTGLPFAVFNPQGGANIFSPPQVNAGLINAGLVNECAQINVSSGWETAQGAAGAAVAQIVSRTNDGTGTSLYNLIADVVWATLPDGNSYSVGQKEFTASAIPVPSTASVNLIGIGPLGIGKRYHVKGWLTYIGNQAAGAPIFSWGTGGSGLALGTTQNGFQRFTGGGVSPIIHNNNGSLGAVTGSVFASNATNWLYDFDVFINVTASGTLFITGASNTAGDSFQVGQAFAEIEPY